MTYQREFADRLRVALVGAGSHANRNILPTLNYLPVRLVAVCDVDGKRAAMSARQYGAKGGAYTDADEMMTSEELDALILCVSAKAHPSLAIKAFEAGLHVWMEKPAGARASQVAGMCSAQGDSHCVVGFKKVFMPATLKLEELLAQHGPLKTILSRYPVSVPANGAELLARDDTENDWLADGCHPVSFMLQIGGPVRAVTVHRSKAGGGVCVFEFASGAVGNLHLAEGAPWSQPSESYMVFGDDASIEIQNGNRVVYQRGIPFDYERTVTFAPPGLDSGAVTWEAQNAFNSLENKAVFTQGLYGGMFHFCDSVHTGRPPTRGTLDLALQVAQVYEAALLSKGTPVSLDEVPV